MNRIVIVSITIVLLFSCKHRSGSRGSQLKDDTPFGGESIERLTKISIRYSDPKAANDMLRIIETSTKWDEVSMALGYFQVNPLDVSEGQNFVAKAARVINEGNSASKITLLETIGFNCGGNICPFDESFIGSAIAAAPGNDALAEWVRFRVESPNITFSTRPELATRLTTKVSNEYEKRLANSGLIILSSLAEDDPKNIGPRILELAHHELVQLEKKSPKASVGDDYLGWLSLAMNVAQSYADLEVAEDRKNLSILLPSDWERMVTIYRKAWQLQEQLQGNPALDTIHSKALNDICQSTHCGFTNDGKLSNFIANGFVTGLDTIDIAKLDFRTTNNNFLVYFNRWRDAIRTLHCGDPSSNLVTPCTGQRAFSATSAIGFVASRSRNYLEGASRLGADAGPKLIREDKLAFVDLMDTVRMAALMQGLGSGTNWKIDPLMSYSPILGEVYASILSPLMSALITGGVRQEREDLYFMHIFESIEGLRFVLQNPDFFPGFDPVLYNRFVSQVGQNFPNTYYLTTTEGPSPIFSLLCSLMPVDDFNDLDLPAKRLDTYARIYYLMPIFAREAKGKTSSNEALSRLSAHQKSLDTTARNFYSTCPNFDVTDVRMNIVSLAISKQLAVFKDAKPESDPRFVNDQLLGLGNADDIVNRRYMFRRF